MLTGLFIGKQVNILKDDGGNTNVLSADFIRHNHRLLTKNKQTPLKHHSDKRQGEASSEVVINATVQVGKHLYTSNWAVPNSRYDVILGIPGHVSHLPTINYDFHTVKIGELQLSTISSTAETITVSNLRVKKFRSMLRKES